MWRDPRNEKELQLEHTVVTTGEAIIQRFAGYTHLRQEHKEGYVYEMDLQRMGPLRRFFRGPSAGAFFPL